MFLEFNEDELIENNQPYYKVWAVNGEMYEDDEGTPMLDLLVSGPDNFEQMSMIHLGFDNEEMALAYKKLVDFAPDYRVEGINMEYGDDE